MMSSRQVQRQVIWWLALLGALAPMGAGALLVQYRDSAPVLPKVLQVRVVNVHDGDTFTCTGLAGLLRVRVAAIDAPELDQVYGPQAAVAAQELLLGKAVTLQVQSRDKYGRVVCGVTLLDGRDFGLVMVRRGWAWWYRSFALGRTDLRDAEAAAHGECAGLWAEAGAVAPWVWRAVHKR